MDRRQWAEDSKAVATDPEADSTDSSKKHTSLFSRAAQCTVSGGTFTAHAGDTITHGPVTTNIANYGIMSRVAPHRSFGWQAAPSPWVIGSAATPPKLLIKKDGSLRTVKNDKTSKMLPKWTVSDPRMKDYVLAWLLYADQTAEDVREKSQHVQLCSSEQTSLTRAYKIVCYQAKEYQLSRETRNAKQCREAAHEVVATVKAFKGTAKRSLDGAKARKWDHESIPRYQQNYLRLWEGHRLKEASLASSAQSYRPDPMHEAVTGKIKEWIVGGDQFTDKAVLWLHGPQGCGKSTLVHNLSWPLFYDKKLGASFTFIDRPTFPARKVDGLNASLLVNIITDIAVTLGNDFVLTVGKHVGKQQSITPDILSRALQLQLHTILIPTFKDFHTFEKRSELIVVIDGFNFSEPAARRTLFAMIKVSVKSDDLPIRYLIVSRLGFRISQDLEREPGLSPHVLALDMTAPTQFEHLSGPPLPT